MTTTTEAFLHAHGIKVKPETLDRLLAEAIVFQFDGDSLLPGLAEVLAELDEELHPISVYRWFTSPNPDLVTEDLGDPITPREWLRRGLPVSEVAALAKHL